ncbi:class I SAM-dependent DNA methyltransferase [Chloroflexota bacterium]
MSELYSDYDPFARVYNKHWGTNFIPLVLPILDKHLLNQLPNGARILDLCCGTGQLAHLLNDRGYSITGLDGSEEMLRYARENDPSVEFILDDARSYKLPGKYDAVISVFDSLNHIMSLEELKDAFRCVYNSLSEGGMFLFDLNMAAGYVKGRHDEVSIVEENTVCIVRSDYSPDEMTASFRTTIFTNDNGWQRSDFTITQRCHAAEAVVAALETAGFTEIRPCTYDFIEGLVDLTSDADRAFFICRKPGSRSR